MKSKFNSKCKLCGSFIKIGDEISKRDNVWAHAICPNGRHTPAAGAASDDLEIGVIFKRPVEVASARINPETRSGFVLSEYQAAVVRALETTTRNIVITAVAGSGKSTMQQIAMYHLPRSASGSHVKAIYLAFNKAIQTSFESKAPDWVEVKTTHSAGMRLLTPRIGRAAVVPEKSMQIMDELFGSLDGVSPDVRAAERMRRKAVAQLVSLCKATLTDASDGVALQGLVDRYSVELTGNNLMTFAQVKMVLDKSNNDLKRIDYDDMLYMAVKFGCTADYDYVLVDECQDLNACQIQFVKNLVKGVVGGRIIAVGDPAQSIYGFRGADVTAIPRLIEELNALVLPLSITYRCPKSHVAMAQALVPSIQAAPTAAEGEIDQIKMIDFSPKDGELCLCRLNVGLVGPALKLIQQGRKAIIKGKDIGGQLAGLADRLAEKCAGMGDMWAALADYKTRETTRLEARHAADSQLIALEDRCMVIDTVMREVETPREVGRKIASIFTDDDTDGVTFSSVHRAKGLEAETVYILMPEKMPLKRKKAQEWETQQETNICYVAYTRSKNRLVFVETEKKSNEN